MHMMEVMNIFAFHVLRMPMSVPIEMMLPLSDELRTQPAYLHHAQSSQALTATVLGPYGFARLCTAL